MRKLLLFLFCLLPSLATWADDTQTTTFSDGFFIVNEDWYGHCNSTINWFGYDGEITKRVVQTVNGTSTQLGCTAPVGIISNGRMYVTSKQAKDPGASVTGGRLTVLDATTMQVVKQFPEFPNGGDGRDVCAVSDQKVYVGSTMGIYVLNTQTLEFDGMVSGSETEGNLYTGQIGTMVLVNGKVFAVSQDRGVLVIDPFTDTVLESHAAPAAAYELTDQAGSLSFGSVVYKSGYLWLSVSDVDGYGGAKDCIVKMDPATCEMTVIQMPEGFGGPANSWYAWTPDGFCSSQKDNYLFWNGGPDDMGSWFAKQTIYRYDITTGKTSLIIDLQATSDYLYGCCLRCNPKTGDLIAGLSMGQQYGHVYEIRVYSPDGELRYTYDLDDGNYWFPSVPLFPQVDRKLVANDIAEAVVPLNDYKEIDVTHVAHDNFQVHALITKAVVSVDDESIASAEIVDNNTLKVKGLKVGKTTVNLKVSTDAESITVVVPISVELQYTVKAEAVTEGTLTFTGTGYYTVGETATIVATPTYGYEFSKWTDGETSATRKVVVGSDVTLRAEAKKRKFTVTVVASPAEGGTVSPAGAVDVEYQGTLHVTATPAEHYEFSSWSDSRKIKTAERDYTVTKDYTLQANFVGKPNNVKITVSPAEAATLSASNSKTVRYGSSTFIRVTAKTGYQFVKWSDGGATTASRDVYGTGEDVDLTVYFELIPYDITVSANPAEGGTVSGSGTYTYGNTATLTAAPAEHYTFSGWADGSTDATRTVTVSAAKAYVANFAIDQFDITATANPVEGGTISGTGSHDYGSTAILTATPAKGYVFTGWADGETAAERTVSNITEDLAFVANFEAIPAGAADIEADKDSDSAIFDILGRRLRTTDGCRLYIQNGRLHISK